MAKDDDGLGGVLQVKTTFMALHKGVEVRYREGEIIHPDDPLLKRFPEHFGKLEFPHDPVKLNALPEPPELEPVPEPPATPEERIAALVDGYTREELNALATEIGIDPADLPNKQAVAEALVGVRATGPAGWTTGALTTPEIRS
jgi:hypothetical protein